MKCPRCGADLTGKPGKTGPWCIDCEKQYDSWVRKHAADILWQTGVGALVAMAIGLGLPLVGVEPVIGITGVLAGFSTFLGLRSWGKKRRRKQFLAGALPRAYLPSRTT
ncbi:MAG TPA: hypothetical protein VL326_13870 [Kofleriaceae bacterium]|jgi:hypothetical protein|nr:hypothetical protein [Kofleriaceae bacterium]